MSLCWMWMTGANMYQSTCETVYVMNCKVLQCNMQEKYSTVVLQWNSSGQSQTDIKIISVKMISEAITIPNSHKCYNVHNVLCLLFSFVLFLCIGMITVTITDGRKVGRNREWIPHPVLFPLQFHDAYWSWLTLCRRMDKNTLQKRVLQNKPTGYLDTGRPKDGYEVKTGTRQISVMQKRRLN